MSLTEISPLSLHDALPILHRLDEVGPSEPGDRRRGVFRRLGQVQRDDGVHHAVVALYLTESARSEEHTSELQSLTKLVFRLLLEKKKTESTSRLKNITQLA